MTHVAIFDTECAPNYWLCKFYNPDTGRYADFELYEDHPLDVDALCNVLRKYLLVGFNSINYDMPMIAYAISGANNAALKKLNDRLINPSVRTYKVVEEYGLLIPHVDHIDLWNVAPGVMDSLKIYGGRLHTKTMQDLPFEPDEPIPPEFFPKVREYCGNDLQQTYELWQALQPAIKVRMALTDKHGIDLRSKSDPQIAEAVICQQVETRNDAPIKRPPQTFEPFKYDVPDFIKFSTSKLNAVLEHIQNSEFSNFTTEAGKDKLVGLHPALNEPIVIHGRAYQFGIGGLHSKESNISWRASKNTQLYEIDATSFYPATIRNCNIYPPQLGAVFLPVFGEIVDGRISAKCGVKELEAKLARKLSVTERQLAETALEELKQLADGGKIMVNGTFGKLKDKFSRLFYPKGMIQVTLTGQLSELMLIERLELHDIAIASANTDGLVVACKTEQREIMQGVIAQWEEETGFKLEEEEYIALFSQNVNNYFAIKPSGKLKRKGVFGETSLTHSPENQICYSAVIAYIEYGIPIEETIRNCTDIREFVTIQKVAGGAMKDGGYVGKAIRWYHSTATDTPIVYKTTGNKVPNTDGCVPCMVLPDSLPEDLDIEWYIQNAKDIMFTPAYKNTPKKESGIGLSPTEIYAMLTGYPRKPLLKRSKPNE